MSDPFIGEIRAVGFNYAPYGWAKCAGQQINITQNQALYALLGIKYGGDARTYFQLPDLQGRCAIGSGRGPGLTVRTEGQNGGTETVTLTVSNLPVHNHLGAIVTGSITATLNVVDDVATELSPAANCMLGKPQAGGADLDGYFAKEPTDLTKIKPLSNKSINVTSSGMNVTIGNTGLGQCFSNMPPYLVINYIIATAGLWPSQE